MKRLLLAGSVLTLLVMVALTQASLAAAGASWGAIWHLDELSGTTVVDSSGNGNNGTSANVLLGLPGLLGTTYGFDGISSVVTVPDSPTLDPGSMDFSFTLSINFSQIPPSDYDLLRKGLPNDTTDYYKVEIVKKKPGIGGWPQCQYSGSLGAFVMGSQQTNLADGQWHTITCAKTTNTLSITVDGVTQTKQTSVGSIDTAGSPFCLGAKCKTRPADLYQGLMDEVSVQAN